MIRAGGLRRRVLFLAAGVGLAVAGSWAWAYVNPNFTPKNVERDAKAIFTVKLESVDADGKGATLAVGEMIKGQVAARKLRLDFAAAIAANDPAAKLEEFIELLKSAGANPGLIAVGDYEGKPCALMHMEACWSRLLKGKDDATWNFDRIDTMLNGTFNGGTDMFIETMRFIRKFPSAPIMPVSGGVQWSEQVKLGTLPGQAAELLAVDANADGLLDIFAACPSGDRLFLQEKDGTFAAKPLEPGSKSLAAVWADFDGDGRPDLASLGKDGLKVWLQKEPGKFTVAGASPIVWKETASPTLGVVDVEPDGKPDLVVGMGWPWLLVNNGKGELAVTQSTAFSKLEKYNQLGLGGPCVVADFDGDGFADIVQTFQKGGLLWHGRARDFENPVECGALMGKPKWRKPLVADLDGDGLLDILLIGGDSTPYMLQNRGGRKFEEVMRLTGESGYIIQPGATCAALGDFNNDTFVDIFAGYDEEPCQFFFNRGFRSFAIHEPLKFKKDDMPGCDDGQAAAVWADFDASGAQKLAVALSGNAEFEKAQGAGTALALGAKVYWDEAAKVAKGDAGGGANKLLGECIRAVGDNDAKVVARTPSADLYLAKTNLGAMDKPLVLRVLVDKEVKSAAPLVVRFYLEGRCLGARVADRWSGPAILGVTEAGTYVVKFRAADGREVSREMEPGGEARSAAGKPAAQPAAPVGTPPRSGAPQARRQAGGMFVALGIVAVGLLVLVRILVAVRVFRKVNP